MHFTVREDGDTTDDMEARALLNKFLGATVLMSGMESLVPRTVTSCCDDGNPNTKNQNVSVFLFLFKFFIYIFFGFSHFLLDAVLSLTELCQYLNICLWSNVDIKWFCPPRT